MFDKLTQQFNPLVLLGALLVLSTTNPVAAQSRNGFDVDGALIPAGEILHGGPGRDGIPSLDRPVFVPADAASFLDEDDRVLGVEIDGIQRAYPIRILNYHEIVNDSIAGTPLVITFCPLCGSGMAFLSTFADRRLEFGVSGLLYNSDVLLYDRDTDSLWSQLLGKAVTGKMKGTRMTAIPLSNTSWREWRSRHPATQVLSSDTGFRINYRANPYPNYGKSGRLYFPVANEDRRYARKAMVMGLEIDGQFKVYPFEELANGPGQIADRFQGQNLEIQFDRGNQTAKILDHEGNEIPTVIAFWFAWYAFHPDTEVYTDSQ
jgi:hypothetical protein